MKSGPKHFDREYYARYYGDPATRVTSQREIHRLGRFVSAYLKYLQLPIRRVLDVGCGFGYWQAVIRQQFRSAEYVGVEYSVHLCRELGWNHGSIVDYQSDEPFDLIICQGVLQYLSKRDAAKAILNLNRLCRGALYLEVVTEHDWENVCDQSVTDGKIHIRPGDWYRQRLDRGFIAGGGGVFISKRADCHLYELERLS